MLPADVLNLIHGYRVQLCISQVNSEITGIYQKHEQEVADMVESAWGDWVNVENPRALDPERWGPGGFWHDSFLHLWKCQLLRTGNLMYCISIRDEL